MFRLLALITFYLFLSPNSYAQTLAITEKGDTIIVYENGTWKKSNETPKQKGVSDFFGTVHTDIKVDPIDKSKRISCKSWIAFAKAEEIRSASLSGRILRVVTDENDFIFVEFTFTGAALGCLSEYNGKATVLLEDDSTVELSQLSNTDCSDSPSARYVFLKREEMNAENIEDIQNENVNILMNQNWKMIRLHGSEYYIDLIPADAKARDNSQFFRQHLHAVLSK